MKPLRLHMDNRPAEQPEQSYPFGKNGVQFDKLGASFNEPGFRKMLTVIPFALNGIIETDTKPVVFSTNNVDSAIGYFNPVTEAYEPIVNDATGVNWPTAEKLGFKLGNYITGEAQRNYKGELIIAFTDKSTFPKYLNCDKPDIQRLADLRLFPFYQPATITLGRSLGGSLDAGTYYVVHRYERNDGTTTPYAEVSSGHTIPPGDLGTSSDNALLITVTGADTTYDFIRFAIISKVGGVTKAVELSDAQPVTAGSMDVLYTGANLSEEISVPELLVKPAIYEKVGTIGQLNDSLYIADLETQADYNDLQPWAAAVVAEWTSELIDATNAPEEHRSGKKKGLMHEEVYALYIQYEKTSGGFTKAYTIPGLPPDAGALVNSNEASTGGYTDPVPRFKVEDTISIFSPATRRGRFGYWQNATEEYPDTADFDATPAGGRNWRSQKVCHHKTPSLRWCKANLYAGEADYGKTKLDLLGVRISNVNIPSKYQGKIKGYRILYARRSSSNMTVYGQAALLHGASASEDNFVTNPVIYTTGGNWKTDVFHQSSGDYNDGWELKKMQLNTFRVHPFDLLFNRPSVEPTFLSAQLKMEKDKLWEEGYLEDNALTGDKDGPTVHLVDYTRGKTPQVVSAGATLRKVSKSFYLGTGISVGQFNNARHEACFAGELAGAAWPMAFSSMGFELKGSNYTATDKTAPYEQTYLVNLIALKQDLFASFYSQQLVSAGNAVPLGVHTFWGGDTYVVDYTFHTYGRHDKADTHGEGIKGKKVIRRIVCESASNLHLRYEIAGNDYSKWYPRTAVAAQTPDQCYITHFDRSKEPNQFGYSKDLNALNDFITSTIFSPYQEEITQHPYRIHRGGKLSRQAIPRSWRSFLPLDYYECVKNMGRIMRVQGMDDRLLIHHENALFLTQDKAQLDAGVLSITLGTGDIFKFEPTEAQSAKHGYAGAQHDLACVMTPVGYTFVDAQLGEVYLYKGTLKNISGGVETFLREHLKVKERNVYSGNGITIGWDQRFKRLLLTVKNNKPTAYAKPFQNTPAFFAALQEGDIVLYEGRYIRYKGINNPAVSGLDCPEDDAQDPVPDPTYTWVVDQVACEQEGGFTLQATIEGLSSPMLLGYDRESARMYVADADNAAGNVYWFDPAAAVLPGDMTPVAGFASICYVGYFDKQYRRIYLAGQNTGGLRVLDLATHTWSLVPYGTDGSAYNRLVIKVVSNRIYCNDRGSGVLVLINRDTLTVDATVLISSIPNSAGYFDDYWINQVGEEIWISAQHQSQSSIARYNLALTDFLGAIVLPGCVVEVNGLKYRQSAYYDSSTQRLWVSDAGSSKLFVLDPTGVIVHEETYENKEGKANTGRSFADDPVTGDLWENEELYNTPGDGTKIRRIYKRNRTNYRREVLYLDTAISELAHHEGTNFLWSTSPGNTQWLGGSWNTDGKLFKYSF